MTGIDDMDGIAGMRLVLREISTKFQRRDTPYPEWLELFGAYARLAEFEHAVYQSVSSEEDNTTKDSPETETETETDIPRENNHASRWAVFTSGLIVADKDGDTYMVVGRTTEGEPIFMRYPKYGGGARSVAERLQGSSLFTLGYVQEAYGPISLRD